MRSFRVALVLFQLLGFLLLALGGFSAVAVVQGIEVPWDLIAINSAGGALVYGLDFLVWAAPASGRWPFVELTPGGVRLGGWLQSWGKVDDVTTRRFRGFVWLLFRKEGRNRFGFPISLGDYPLWEPTLLSRKPPHP